MNVYDELAKLPVFSIKDVQKLTGNVKTAYSKLGRLIKKGMVRKIRRNIFSPVNPVTGQVVANRYQIACAVSETAYISHHSAFEYYGLTNQVYYEVYVSSETRFRDFIFNNINYKYIASRMKQGIIKAKNTSGVRITDLERTVLDSIQDFKKIGGFEELLNCLEDIQYLDENKLKEYLDIYDTKALYQKAGYLLEYHRKDLHLSKEFIEYCKQKVGRSKRYLIREANKNINYNSEWGLMVPEGLSEPDDHGGDLIV